MSSGLLSNQIVDTSSTDPFVPWTRPADWLTLTDPTIGQEKIVLLCLVQPHDANFLAFTISGAYTVDWGDGTSTVNVASGVKTSKVLLWASYSGGTLTSRGYRQAIITITPQAGQSFTSIDFSVAHATPPAASGYPSPILDMVVAGPSITSMQIGTGAGNAQYHRNMERFRFVGTNAILTMTTGFQNCTSLRTFAATNGQGYDLWLGSCSNATSMFNNCFSLESGPALYTTGTLANTSSMFISCGSLRSAALFNTSSVTNTSQMFQGCSALVSLPSFDWSSLSNATNMFHTCSALISVPAANTPVLSTVTQMLNSCAALTVLPAWDYSKVTSLSSFAVSCAALVDISPLSSALATGISALCADMTSAFNSCRSLRTIPPINTSGVLSMSSAFQTTAIQTLPTPSGNNWKTSACTNFQSMFNACPALQTIPLIDTSAGTNFQSMFSGCTALPTVPLINTSAGTNFTQTFFTCSSLQSVPALNVANGTVFTSMFGNCGSLQSAPLVGARFAISYASCLLNAAALDAVYTGLGTASGSQTITVTSNPGTTGDTPSIATGKGWTVAGS